MVECGRDLQARVLGEAHQPDQRCASGSGSYDGYIEVTPSTVVEDDDGGVSFIVEGRGFPARMELEVHSNALDAACLSGSSLNGRTATANFNGRFNLAASGSECVPGTYTVEVSEQSTPYQTFIDELTIEAP